MEYSYCPNCGKMTGHKRALGIGTLLGAAVTWGASLGAVPFYPKRCIVCGMRKTEEIAAGPERIGVGSDDLANSLEKLKFSLKRMDKTFERIDGFEALKVGNLGSRPTKICPQCAEEIKTAAKICRFCRYEFPQSPEL